MGIGHYDKPKLQNFGVSQTNVKTPPILQLNKKVPLIKNTGSMLNALESQQTPESNKNNDIEKGQTTNIDLSSSAAEASDKANKKEM